MRVAVMQPYLFPYAGYFQVACAVETFVFYDDVQFIAQGYIHRNRLPHGPFTVPLAAAGHRAAINERTVDPRGYRRFLSKWRRGVRQAYARAPFAPAVERLLDHALAPGETSIAALSQRSVMAVCDYLALGTRFGASSAYDYDRSAATQDKLLSLLGVVGATYYLNPVGGAHLYDARAFAARGIELAFLRSTLPHGDEGPGFGYSILHLLAHHPPARVREWLRGGYTLTNAHEHAATS